MAALVLDFRDERHHLSGPGEHFHQRRGGRRRVPFQRRPARRGAQRLFVGLRDFPGPRRETCRPVRSEARADRGRSLVGSLHGAHRLDSRSDFEHRSHVAPEWSLDGCPCPVPGGALYAGRGRGRDVSELEPLCGELGPDRRARDRQRRDFRRGRRRGLRHPSGDHRDHGALRLADVLLGVRRDRLRPP